MMMTPSAAAARGGVAVGRGAVRARGVVTSSRAAGLSCCATCRGHRHRLRGVAWCGSCTSSSSSSSNSRVVVVWGRRTAARVSEVQGARWTPSPTAAAARRPQQGGRRSP